MIHGWTELICWFVLLSADPGRLVAGSRKILHQIQSKVGSITLIFVA